MVSHPGLGSDPSIGSDRESGRDSSSNELKFHFSHISEREKSLYKSKPLDNINRLKTLMFTIKDLRSKHCKLAFCTKSH